MGKRQADFSVETIRIVAERAGYLCSNPNCRKPTIKPHSDSEKSLSTGVAAHICAAQKKGPRYEANQPSEERRHISNAIWLCHNCSDMVDKDITNFPKELLIKWKTDHEEFLKAEKYIPDFPKVQLNTHRGLVIDLFKSITHEQQKQYRQHRLLLKNDNNTIIQDIHLTIQFPEVMLNQSFKGIIPAGINIQIYPANQGSILVSGAMEVSGDLIDGAASYKFSIDRLLPRQELKVDWLSIENPNEISDIPIVNRNTIHFFIEGTFQYEFHNSFYERELFVPLTYDSSERMVTSLPPDNRANWNVRRRMSFPY